MTGTVALTAVAAFVGIAALLRMQNRRIARLEANSPPIADHHDPQEPGRSR